MKISDELSRLVEDSRGLAREGTPGLVASLYERVEAQRELNRLLNEFKEEVDPEKRDHLKQEIGEKQRQFHLSNGGGHSNPEWILPTMDACIAYTFQDYKEAERLDRAALPFAKEPWQRAISLANISDSVRLQDDPTRMLEAAGLAFQAVGIDKRNDGFWAYFVLAAYRAGLTDFVCHILREIPGPEDAKRDDSVWRAYLKGYRQEFARWDGECGEVIAGLFRTYELPPVAVIRKE